MRSTNGRRLTIVATVIVGLVGAGVATASWLASGTGAGNAQATTVQELTVSAAVPIATLYPEPSGGYSDPATGTVVATVSNPNAFPVQLTDVSLGAITLTPAGGKTCAAGSVVPAGGVTGRALTPAVLVPAGSSGTQISIPAALEMLPTAEDGCQGVAVSVALTVSGTVA